MSDAEMVITFQSERELWYVQRGDSTAMVSAEDMVSEYYRWRRVGAPGVWRDRAREFCRERLEVAGAAISRRSSAANSTPPTRQHPASASQRDNSKRVGCSPGV